MGGMVANTLVRTLTRKAAGKAMSSAKRSMGAKKGKGRKKKGNARGKKPVD